MADLPRSDLMTDEASPRLRSRVPRLPYTSDDKQPFTMDERVDSGVGYSLESQEYSALSFEGVRDYLETDSGKIHRKQMVETNHSSTTCDNFTSSLQNQLRNLSIRDSDQTKDLKSNRCDSGICDSGNFSVEEPFLEAAFPECHGLSSTVSCESTFSAQELEELFSQDEDGDT